MRLFAHGSVLALLAALVLIWAHETVGTVTYWKLRGNRGPRGRLTERYWQRLVLMVGILLLIGAIVSLALSTSRPRDRRGVSESRHGTLLALARSTRQAAQSVSRARACGAQPYTQTESSHLVVADGCRHCGRPGG